jgi:DNA-binding transcriptional regulator YiaG
MISIEERKKIKRRIPLGSCTDVAVLAEVSKKTVTNWFAGKGNSKKVESVVLEILESRVMISEVDRRMIRRQLPLGSCMEIAKIAGVSKKTVSNWFSGKINSSIRVENAALQIFDEINKDRKRKLKAAGL